MWFTIYDLAVLCDIFMVKRARDQTCAETKCTFTDFLVYGRTNTATAAVTYLVTWLWKPLIKYIGHVMYIMHLHN